MRKIFSGLLLGAGGLAVLGFLGAAPTEASAAEPSPVAGDIVVANGTGSASIQLVGRRGRSFSRGRRGGFGRSRGFRSRGFRSRGFGRRGFGSNHGYGAYGYGYSPYGYGNYGGSFYGYGHGGYGGYGGYGHGGYGGYGYGGYGGGYCY